MSDPVFPLVLPPQNQGGYTIAPDARSTEMKLDNGGRAIWAVRNETWFTHTMKWTFTQTEYDIFEAFCEDVLDAYSLPFICPWSDRQGGLVAQRVIFTEEPETTLKDNLSYEVSASLMTAGTPMGKFGYFVNVDGTTGGVEEVDTGGGAQDPNREIHLTNRTLRIPNLNGPLYFSIRLDGKLQTYDITYGANFIVVNEWKAASNNTPSSQYAYAISLEIVDWRDYAGQKTQIPPVVYGGGDQNILQMSASVPSITSTRTMAIQANNAFPYLKYRATVKITDTVSGHQETGIYTLIAGVEPTP